MSTRILLLLLTVGLTAPPLGAQPIDQSRGADARVDYRSLVRLGPWDDRNYQLTAEDLALLAPDEEAQTDPIPAFFRVELRRHWPELRRSGPAQYPRSALQIFRQLHRGYRVGGKYYRRATREDRRFRVVLDEDSEIRTPAKFLAGEARVTSPEGAAESAIKINPVSTDVVIAGSNGPGNGQVMHYSVNGGVTWNAASALPLGGTCCDPTVDWKSDGSIAHTATLGNCSNSGCAIWYYRSNNGGRTWNGLETVTPGDPRRELTTNGSDKEFLHVDKYAASPHRDNVYLTWHDNNVMQFARSTDDGHTWSKISFSSDPLGIGSDIATDKNGHVYYFWPAFDSRQILLKKSTDGGASFAAASAVSSTEGSFAFPIPAMDTREAFIYVAADADLSNGPFGGTVYLAWTDSTAATGSNAANNHARIRVAWSRNGGASWTVVTPHETADQSSVDRFHPWLGVGPDGKVHVAFYDTRRSATRSSVDIFYSTSVDGGQSFSAPIRLTAQQSPKINDSFEFGDYNGLDVVMNDVIAIFTDNRQEGGGGGDSVDVYVAGLSGGGGGGTIPTVTITSPANGTSVGEGTPIAFAGTAADAEDGGLTSSLAWSSSLDGAIGNGGSFSSTLSAGVHTVTASVTDSDDLTGSSSVMVTVSTPGGGEDFSESFEGGAGAWTTSGLWHLVDGSSCASPGYASPTRAMYYGRDSSCDYDTGAATSGNLVSPAIDCVTAGSALAFQYFRQVERTFNDPYETTSVAVSVVGQPSWTTVWSKTSLQASENAWASSGQISLASYAGQTIQLRFRFDSADEIENGFVGWLVDDVVVSGCGGGGGGGDLIFADGFESGNTSAWTTP